MLVREVMTRSVETIEQHESVATAARKMKSAGVGLLVVCEQDRPVGVLTDRDIVVRSSAMGEDPSSVPVAGAMTPAVLSCAASDGIEAAVATMRERAVRRLVVLDAGERLAGILSVDDVALRSPALAGEIVEHALAPERPATPRTWPWRE